jgi:hypothetical protein
MIDTLLQIVNAIKGLLPTKLEIDVIELFGYFEFESEPYSITEAMLM